MNPKSILASELLDKKHPGICILDVRTSAEVEAESLPGCLHIPLHELTPDRLQAELKTSDKNPSPIYLLCQAGRRAEMAAKQLQGKVNAELCVIEGGMNAIKQASIPIQKSGRRVIALERQVRIATGFLVVSGVLLGSLVAPQFYVLAGVVGAGLMFAGITDTCMMGMLLARMPWNK